MSIKRVVINLKEYDAGRENVIRNDDIDGTTVDDGVTCVIPNGYLPMIESADPQDITVNVYPAPIEKKPLALVSRVNDEEANTSTLTFTLPA
jgi:hypothetical protein